MFSAEQLFNEFKTVDDKFAAYIGNDVWIGDDVSILGGVCIGDGAIIGTGAVVTKDVEPYSINAGVPAKKIGMRFRKEEIDVLQNVKWWNYDETWLRGNAEYFSDIKWFCAKFAK